MSHDHAGARSAPVITPVCPSLIRMGAAAVCAVSWSCSHALTGSGWCGPMTSAARSMEPAVNKVSERVCGPLRGRSKERAAHETGAGKARTL